MTRPLLALALLVLAPAAYGVEKFMPRQGGDTELWRITHDPVYRDWASYHIRNCWSSDGRYLAAEHYLPYWHYSKSRTEVRVYDLHTGKTTRFPRALDPRWANHHNWLFYMQWKDGDKSWRPRKEVRWWDLDRDRNVSLGVAATSLGTTDYQDKWLYASGVMEPRDTGARGPGRIPIRENATPEPISVGGQLEGNPFHPKVYTRVRNIFVDFRPTRVFFDPDGSNLSIASPCLQQCHQSWSGGGKYYLFGNQPMRGRLWDEPFPSNQLFLTNTACGDICRCGKSDRWLCGSGNYRGLQVADLRSGDGRTYLPFALSYLHASPTFDYAYDSALHDNDSKGSPDGTKICFVTNYDLKDGPVAVITKVASKRTGPGLHVNSTEGFPEKGRLAYMNQIIGYARKTPTTFLGLTRGMYGTPSNRMRRARGEPRTLAYLKVYPSDLRPGQPVTSFDWRIIPKEKQDEKLRAPRLKSKRFKPDWGSPLQWQRQTDVYVAVVRKPDRPWLRKTVWGVELIPGENHWETFGYHVHKDGKRITAKPLRPGTRMTLDTPGAYSAVAVEFAGLESLPSAPVRVGRANTELSSLRDKLRDKPRDFLWTSERWLVDGRPVSEKAALRAAEAVREIVHRYDGVIHREWHAKGVIARRHDLNLEGKPTRQSWYRDGRLSKKEHRTPAGVIVTRELFDKDGFVTYAEQYRKGRLEHRWWYVKGAPVKLWTRRGGHHTASPKRAGTYMKQGTEWVKIK